MSTFVDVTLRSAQKDSLCVLAHWFCVSRKGGTGGGGWGHPQGDLHMLQSCQLSCILRETRNLTLTRIITSISRAKHFYTRHCTGRNQDGVINVTCNCRPRLRNGRKCSRRAQRYDKTEDRRQGKPEKVELL